MNLINPAALWLSLVAAPVLLLFLLKIRRREVMVPSTLFWRKVLASKRESALWRRLRSLLSLLLHLLFIAAGTMALTQPFLLPEESGEQPKLSVLVVDVSASMNTVEDDESEETRLDLAKDLIYERLDELKPGTRVAVIAAGVRPEVVMPVTDDVETTRERVEDIEETDAAGALLEALTLADDLALAHAPAEVHLYSDGGGLVAEAERREDAPPLFFHPIGDEESNVGITAFAVRRLPASDLETEMLVGLKNTTAADVALTLEIYLDGVLIDSVEVEASPWSDEIKVFNRELPRGGAVGVAISSKSAKTAGDALPSDNYAYTILTDRPPLKVLLVSPKEHFFLSKAIAEHPSFRAYIVEPEGFTSSVGFDVVIFNQVAPASEAIANALYISSVGTHIPFKADEKKLPNVAVRYVDDEHPLMRHVELHDAVFAASRSVEVPEGATIIVEGTGGPMLVGYERTDRRDVYLAFTEADSDLPLRVVYPNLVANIITWLGTPREEKSAPTLRVGEVAKIPVSPKASGLHILLPNGEEDEIPVRPGQTTVSFTHTTHAGIYVVTELFDAAEEAEEGEAAAADGGEPPAPRSGRFAVNLTDGRESNIAPIEELELDEEEPPRAVVASGIFGWLQSADLWRYLAFLALGLVALEWLFYSRRWVF